MAMARMFPGDIGEQSPSFSPQARDSRARACCVCVCCVCARARRCGNGMFHFDHSSFNSGVAQWLACWAHNPKVRGSKPRSARFQDICLGPLKRSPKTGAEMGPSSQDLRFSCALYLGHAGPMCPAIQFELEKKAHLWSAFHGPRLCRQRSGAVASVFGS